LERLAPARDATPDWNGADAFVWSAGDGRLEAIGEIARVPLVLTWLERVEAALGLRPILYTRRGFVQTYFPDPGQLTDYLLWVAHYTGKPAPDVPAGWQDWTFWQFSETGTVPGIAGSVDLDRFNGTLEQLRALAVPV